MGVFVVNPICKANKSSLLTNLASFNLLKNPLLIIDLIDSESNKALKLKVPENLTLMTGKRKSLFSRIGLE